MGALVFSLPQRHMQRVLMPGFCVVHSAQEAALKISLLELDISQKLAERLRVEASQNVEAYLRAPSWSMLEIQIYLSMDRQWPHCTPPSVECRTRLSGSA